MSERAYNLLTRAMRGDSRTINGVSFSWDGDWFRAVGTATGDTGWHAYKSTDIPIVADKKYTLSVEFADGMPGADTYISSVFQLFSDFSKNTYKNVLRMNRNEHVALSVDQSTLDAYHVGFQIWGPSIKRGATVDVRVRYMLVEGTTPAAWAPAEGETISGGGAQMSANLWSDSTASMQIRADGTYLAGKAGTAELNSKVTGLDSLTENQTVHMGASLKGAGAGVLKPYVEYKDAAGNTNCVGFPSWQPTDSWQRFEGTCVVPSGMTIHGVGFSNDAATGNIQVANPVFSYGSPVPLATSAHTPYATQDHVSVTYATKASLKVTDDSVKAEVSARAQTDRNVADLSSRLTQTANSLTMEINSKVTKVQTDVDSNAADVNDLNSRLTDEIKARQSFMRFSEESSDPTLTLGQTDSPAQVKLTNKQLQFLYLNTVVAYMSGDALLINNAKILQQLQLGGFAFVPRGNGNLAFKWVGGDS